MKKEILILSAALLLTVRFPSGGSASSGQREGEPSADFTLTDSIRSFSGISGQS